MVVLKKALDVAFKLSKYDKRAWDKLYFGIRNDIKLGIKHGFGAGSIIGNFIGEETTEEGGGSVSQQGNGFKASSSYKTRSGRGRSYNRYTKCRPTNRYNRCPSHRFSNSMRNW